MTIISYKKNNAINKNKWTNKNAEQMKKFISFKTIQIVSFCFAQF